MIRFGVSISVCCIIIIGVGTKKIWKKERKKCGQKD